MSFFKSHTVINTIEDLDNYFQTHSEIHIKVPRHLVGTTLHKFAEYRPSRGSLQSPSCRGGTWTVCEIKKRHFELDAELRYFDEDYRNAVIVFLEAYSHLYYYDALGFDLSELLPLGKIRKVYGDAPALARAVQSEFVEEIYTTGSLMSFIPGSEHIRIVNLVPGALGADPLETLRVLSRFPNLKIIRWMCAHPMNQGYVNRAAIYELMTEAEVRFPEVRHEWDFPHRHTFVPFQPSDPGLSDMITQAHAHCPIHPPRDQEYHARKVGDIMSSVAGVKNEVVDTTPRYLIPSTRSADIALLELMREMLQISIHSTKRQELHGVLPLQGKVMNVRTERTVRTMRTERRPANEIVDVVPLFVPTPRVRFDTGPRIDLKEHRLLSSVIRKCVGGNQMIRRHR